MRTQGRIKSQSKEEYVRGGGTISPKICTLALEDVFKALSWQNKGPNINGVHLHCLQFVDESV